MALLGFAELGLVAAELFRRSAATAELAAHLRPPGPFYEGLFGFTIRGHGTDQQFLSLDDAIVAYGGSGPSWQWTLIAGFLAVVAWHAVVRRPGPKTVAVLAAGVVVAVPVLDLLAYSWFGLDAPARGPILATLGLALAAWSARSFPVLAVAVVAGAAAVVVADLAGVTISAGVLLAGAVLPRWGSHGDLGSRWPRWTGHHA